MPLDNHIPRSRLTSLIERERRSSKKFPETDSPSFCREILNGAVEAPERQHHPEYLNALMDVGLWAARKGFKFDPDTIDALRAEITRLKQVA